MRWKLKLRSDYRARAAWDAGLTWYRLRYQDAQAARRVLTLLSRPQAAGRVALFYAPGAEISRLYVGVPQSHTRALQRAARDFAFTVREATSAVAPPATAMVPASDLFWERAFVAHIVDGHAFIGKPDSSGPFLPHPGAAESKRWQLLGAPPAGLTSQPSWNGHPSPGGYAANSNEHGGHVHDGYMCGEGEGRSWPLGWGRDGTPLHACGPVNLYGRQDAVTAWLVRLVSHLLATDPAGLIVVDGAGDLVPALKRKSVVTRHLGRELAYVDIDGTAVVNGFNPLAPVPGEKPADTLERWQKWFGALQVHPAGLELLGEAQQAGLTDIPGLRQWLQQPAQQHRPVAAHALQAALKRLLADPLAREWLSWPTNIFAGLPAGSLLFACPGCGWSRRRLLEAAVLAALRIAPARIILHGLPWQEIQAIHESARQVLLSNGPATPDSTHLLLKSHARGAELLADRFLHGDVIWRENLELLSMGTGILVYRGAGVLASWQQPARTSTITAETMTAIDEANAEKTQLEEAADGEIDYRSEGQV